MKFFNHLLFFIFLPLLNLSDSKQVIKSENFCGAPTTLYNNCPSSTINAFSRFGDPKGESYPTLAITTSGSLDLDYGIMGEVSGRIKVTSSYGGILVIRHTAPGSPVLFSAPFGAGVSTTLFQYTSDCASSYRISIE